MSRRFVLPILTLAASLALVSLPARAADAKPTPTPTGCSSRSVDLTSPALRAILSGLQSVRAIGVPTMRQTSTANISSQDFDIVDSTGATSTVTVTCAATGCISGCATTGCNPTTLNGEPACTSLVCRNVNGGLPCSIQGSCAKTVAQSGSSSSSTGN